MSMIPYFRRMQCSIYSLRPQCRSYSYGACAHAQMLDLILFSVPFQSARRTKTTFCIRFIKDIIDYVVYNIYGFINSTHRKWVFTSFDVPMITNDVMRNALALEMCALRILRCSRQYRRIMFATTCLSRIQRTQW